MRLLTIIGIVLLGAAAVAQPRLDIPNNEVEFGLTPQNSTVRHHFWFQSTGTDTVYIDTIITGCSCTHMPLHRKWLAPGDSMEVGVFWEIGRRVGHVSQYPRVHYGDDIEPARMSLKAQAVRRGDEARPVSASPYKLELARTATLDRDSLSFELTNRIDGDLRITLISPPAAEFDYVVPDFIEAGETVSGYVKVRPEYADAEFKGVITVEFNDSKDTRLTLPVRRKFY